MTAHSQQEPPSVLVYQIGSLGDTIVSVPTYRAVRRHFGPKARILVLHNAPPAGRASPHEVLDGSGLVDGAVTFQQYAGRSTWKTWEEVWTKLRRIKPAAVVYIGPGERTAKLVQRDRLFFQLCRVPELIGFHACDTQLEVTRDPAGRPRPVPHEAVVRLERLEKDGIAPDRASDMRLPLLTLPLPEREKALRWLDEHRPPGKAVVAVCPGANQSAKFWPMERFEEIGRRLLATGDFELLVIGGPVERAMGDRLLTAWGSGINAAGQFSVMGSAALLSQCRFLVGLDTGTTHLAAALSVPCVALYADRDPPGQWEPLGDDHILLRHPVPCGGCGLKDCTVAGHPCMSNLSVEQVWAAVETINARLSVRRRSGESHFAQLVVMLPEPGDGLGDAGTQIMGRLEAEKLFGPRHIQAAARLAVGLGGIPNDLAGKADLFGDDLGQIADSDLLAGSEVDRQVAVVALRRQ